MIRIPKSIFSFGALAPAAGLLTLAVSPAAHAVATALVQVTNTPANPVPDRDVDAAGRHPFASSCSVGDGDNECSLPTVPANTEYVIQTIAVVIQVGPAKVAPQGDEHKDPVAEPPKS